MAAKFELKKSRNDKFLFNLLGDNGQALVTSEMYEAKASALNGIESVRKNSAEEKRFELLSAKDGASYFSLKATNGQVIGSSPMYASAALRDAAIAAVRSGAAAAQLDDQT